MCYDGDPVDLVRSGQRRARIAHPCAECGRTIEPGETYLYEAWVYEGDFDTHKTCAHCAAARRWLVEVCSSWQYHVILEELAEHWDEDDLYRSLSFGRIIVSSRTRWTRGGGAERRLIPVETVEAWVADALRRVPSLAGAG